MEETTYPCPVCNTPLVIDVGYIDHIQTERTETCGLCGYHYEFVYGNMSEYIGEWERHAGWDDEVDYPMLIIERRAAIRRRKEEMNQP